MSNKEISNTQKRDNAADRYSYIGHIFDLGSQSFKQSILNSLPPQYAKLHKYGYIHIHDLDAYGLSYNCLTFNTKYFTPPVRHQ